MSNETVAAHVSYEVAADGHRWDAPPKVRFATDSAQEGTGFEPSVPGCERVGRFGGMGIATEAAGGSPETAAQLTGD
jgi:hypothetical protein